MVLLWYHIFKTVAAGATFALAESVTDADPDCWFCWLDAINTRYVTYESW
jgi:hypothetical protein